MTRHADILIVDDEQDIRSLIAGILEDEGYSVRQSGHARGAYAAVEERVPDLAILDIWLQGSAEDGIDILTKIKTDHPHLPVLMISGHGTIETAVSAIKKGAYDFIEKPFKADRLLIMIARALETAALKSENESLRAKVDANLPKELIGMSEAVQTLRQTVEKTAKANSRVLITGEAGCGKNLVARLLHGLSDRKDKGFEVISSASLETATMDKVLLSAVERVRGGTLVLDEISDMNKDVQARLVRILQDQKIQQGPGQMITFDVRFLATTANNPQGLIEAKILREDLYYRLGVVTIDVAPLRNHAADITALADYFAKKLSPKQNISFDPGALSAMERYRWPGNIRQLRNVIEGALIIKSGHAEPVISREDLPPEISGLSKSAESAADTADLSLEDLTAMPLREARELFETKYLAAQFARFDGSVAKMAASIGMERSALHRKLKSLGITTHDKSDEDSVVILRTSAS